MANSSTYANEFGSWNQALTAVGLTLNCQRGFVTVDVLISPLLAPIDGALKLMETVRTQVPRAHAAAAQTLRGGAIFFLGSLGADGIDAARSGDWSVFKKISPKELAQDYAALTLGSEVGRRVTHLAVARIPTMVMPVPIKSLAVRTGSLTAALALVNRMKTGEMNWAHLPQEVATILAASGAVQGVTAVASKSSLLRSAAQFLKLSSSVGKSTFLGAVASSIAEFALIREISRMEIKTAAEPAITEVRHTLLQLLHADAKLQHDRRAGIAVDEQQSREIRRALENIQKQLAAVPSVSAQMRIAKYNEDLQSAADARDTARRLGFTDADWNYSKQVARLSSQHQQDMARIAADDAKAQGSARDIREAAEFQLPRPSDAAVDLSDIANETQQNENYARQSLDALILPADFHIIAHQLKDYLSVRN
ncbi:MAG: hypothetical protein Q7T25_11345, partial [Sideroxyarcus sp.]|nr:hypothetical protein [Sideroxyarcus sp.]